MNRLDFLAESIRACEKCKLCLEPGQAVPGEGWVGGSWMLVGEAPGRDEARVGRPFVGASGRRLDVLIGVSGLKRERMWVTNLVKHRPPNNRTPLQAEVKACKSWLEQEIGLINPLWIVTLGVSAMKGVCGKENLEREHGKGRVVTLKFPSRECTVMVVPMYHPASAFRKPSLWEVMVGDWTGLADTEVIKQEVRYQLGTEQEVMEILE